MQIWRLEDDWGNGPHQDGSAVIETILRESVRKNPDRRDDFPARSMPWRRTRFGFAGRETLIDWFGFETVAKLMNLGYQLKAFYAEEEDVCRSNSRTQLMFNADAARFGFAVTDPRELFQP